MKKTTFIVILFFFSYLPLIADNTIRIENSNVTVPDTERFYIVMENDVSVNGLNVIIKYDPSLITPTTIQPVGHALSMSDASGHKFSEDKISFVVFDQNAIQIAPGSGRIFEIEYLVTNPLISETITTTIECYQGMVADAQITEIPFDYANGIITIHPDPMLGIDVVINEIITDPQQDWNDSDGGNGIPFDRVPGSGSITDTDEWVELLNIGDKAIDLTEGDGWTLEFIDTTPEMLSFDNPGSTVKFVFSKGGSLTDFQPGEYLVIGNPPGNVNNDVFIVLKNNNGELIDDVELGDDLEGDGTGDGAPDGGAGGGDATGIEDEAIARFPDGEDTDDDVTDFTQQIASINFSNEGEECLTYHFPVEGGSWYMVSLPVTPFNTKVTEIFPFAIGSIGLIWKSHQYEVVDSMLTTNGYWIAILKDTTMDLCGAPVDSFTIHFPEPGWYMIGTVMDSIGFTEPDDMPDGSVLTPAFRYNSLAGQYEEVNGFRPGEGYWVAVVQECYLSIGKRIIPKITSKATTGATDFYAQFGDTPPAPPNTNWKEYTLPNEYTLEQNYPNPFNPSATIEYGLPEDSHVEIIIYNILGQKIRTLVNKRLEAGYHKIVWNGKNDAGQFVASGVYIYRIKAGSFINSRKMILIK